MSLPTPPCTTDIECACFLTFVNSGWNIGNVSTYGLVLDDKTVQRYHPTGTWIGKDAIAEYLSGYGSDVATRLSRVGAPSRLDFSPSTSPESCAVWTSGVSRVATKLPYSSGEIPTCVDFVSANFITYKISDDPSADYPMLVTEWDILTDDFFTTALFGALDTPTTAEYTCEAILACEDQQQSSLHLHEGHSHKKGIGKKEKKGGKEGKPPTAEKRRGKKDSEVKEKKPVESTESNNKPSSHENHHLMEQDNNMLSKRMQDCLMRLEQLPTTPNV